MNAHTNTPISYISPKLEGRAQPIKGGFGIFAREFVHSGEILIAWGGSIITEEQLAKLTPQKRKFAVQIEENLYQLTDPPGIAELVNHSCNPNAGISGQITLVAIVNIAPGVEVCYDYATTDSNPYDEFQCACGSYNCRGYVTANDWRIPELWERYSGYFSPYLQRRIQKLKKKNYGFAP